MMSIIVRIMHVLWINNYCYYLGEYSVVFPWEFSFYCSVIIFYRIINKKITYNTLYIHPCDDAMNISPNSDNNTKSQMRNIERNENRNVCSEIAFHEQGIPLWKICPLEPEILTKWIVSPSIRIIGYRPVCNAQNNKYVCFTTTFAHIVS
jgi:hypothetical protein